jgi:cellulose synthase/poly-beta-1,6-N-acetylglucosamine synthase-like glycosyltransferase
MSVDPDVHPLTLDGRGHHSRVALIIPALDEAVTIGSVVRAVPAALVDDVVVVDNGSTDGTAAEARRAGARVVVEPRRGYGAACLAGVRATAAETAVVAFIDGDGSQDPSELDRILAPLLEGRADLVLGARRTGGRSADHPIHAVLGTRAVAQVLRWRFGVRLRDLGPFRAIRRDTLLALGLREMTYGWPVEMVARAAQAGLRIHEVEVTHRPRLGGTSKVAGTVTGSMRAGWRFVRVALRSR